MASTALGSAYVLTDEGVRQLADMSLAGSAPVSSPGFYSQLRDSSNAAGRLSALEQLVRAHSDR
jgi:hypothetical protein